MDTESSHNTAAGESHVVEYATSRPRVLGWVRSAALLDGDWGTSIAYVLGISFALAGYQSFWHLLLMLGLTALVAINYVTICRLHPNGGGVYSSTYHRSKNLAVIGALLLGADYIVTMALSVLDACHYFGFDNVAHYVAIGIIVGIGMLNWYGPRHSGGLAVIISFTKLASLLVVVGAVLVAYFFSEASFHVEPLEGGFKTNWVIFAGIILSISGIETISNMTGLMKDPEGDSRKAIFVVLSKVVLVTVILALGVAAISGIGRTDHTEDMVRFVAEHYVGSWYGWIIGATLGLLLVSAGNTALNGLISIQFLMSVDKELPAPLRKLNRHGVPIFPLVISTVSPIIVLLFINDLLTLSHLYAIGVVGAVTINVAATGTDRTMPMKPHVRVGMLLSAVILFLIELTIATQKIEATIFASVVLFIGLGARAITQYRRPSPAVPEPVTTVVQALPIIRRRRKQAPETKYLVAVKELNDRLLKFAIEEAQLRNAMLLVLRVKEIKVDQLPERFSMSANGVEHHFDEICSKADIDYEIISVPSNEVGYTIAEMAATFGVERVMIGTSSRSLLEHALKGSVIRSISSLLPEDVQVLIFG